MLQPRRPWRLLADGFHRMVQVSLSLPGSTGVHGCARTGSSVVLLWSAADGRYAPAPPAVALTG
ncbi:hypothetical protein C9885_29625 [Klebsiella pneumoniae]|nr:hypothetical protein C9885_29625 [Klebsiella pneumoniae]